MLQLPPSLTINPSRPLASIVSYAFSNDGSSIYVLEHVWRMNAWSVMVSYWPEIIGALLACLTILLLLRLRSVLRHPHVLNAPICRRCHYDLSSQVTVSAAARPELAFAPDAQCPECGTRLADRPPRHSQRARRRLAPMLTLWLVAVLAYASVQVLKLPRTGRLNDWASWGSSDLMQFASEHKLKWGRHLVLQDHLIEYQTSTGALVRTVLWGSSRSPSITLTPDEKSVILATAPDAVGLFDLRSGARRSQCRIPGVVGRDPDNPLVVGFSRDSGTAYLQWEIPNSRTCGVTAWDFASNRGAEAASAQRGGEDDFPDQSTFVMLSIDPPSFVLLPHSTLTRESATGYLMLRSKVIPVVSSERTTLYSFEDVRGVSNKNLVSRRLADGAVLSEVSRQQSASQLALSPDDRFLVVAGGGWMDVRDVTKDAWVAQLRFSGGIRSVQVQDPVISGGSHWVAARFMSQTSTPTGLGIFIWDLSRLR